MKKMFFLFLITLAVIQNFSCKKECTNEGVIFYKIVVETTGGVSATYNDNVFATPYAPAYNQLYTVTNSGTFTATYKIGSNPQQTAAMTFSKPQKCKKRTYTIRLRDTGLVLDFVDENN